MLCAVVLQLTFYNIATRIDAPICVKENKKACKDRHFCLFLQAFAVTGERPAAACLLLEQLCHTDLINQPAFLLCLVDDIARLAVPDQKGRGGIVHTHIPCYSHTAGVGVAVKAAVTAGVVGADICRQTAGFCGGSRRGRCSAVSKVFCVMQPLQSAP